MTAADLYILFAIKYKMEATLPDDQQLFLNEELAQFGKQADTSKKWDQYIPSVSVWANDIHEVDPLSDPNRHRFNHYADKQLQHLVLAEEFDFAKIAGILSKLIFLCRLRLQRLKKQVY